MRVRGAEAESKWLGLISEQEQSGKTVAAFCRERGVPASQIFAWKRRIRDKAAARFVQVKVAPVLGFEEIAPSRSGIEVRLVGGHSLMVEPGFDPSHLRALLAVLDNRP